MADGDRKRRGTEEQYLDASYRHRLFKRTLNLTVRAMSLE